MKIESLCVGPIGANCYLLEDETAGKAAVIDPGGDGEAIAAALDASGCALASILLTHGHYDHTGAAALLKERFPDVPVYLHQGDVYEDARMRELFPAIPGVRHYGEGDVIAVGSLRIEVLETPGHSEGSVTLRCGDVLFCGDTLFAGSCGRTDFPGGDGEKMFRSLRRLSSLPGDLTVLPGHMEPSTLETERRTNPYVREALRRAP